MKYKVLVPVGKEKPGPGYAAGATITDKDLPKEIIDAFVAAGFIKPIATKDKKKNG